ncbi:MAG: 3-phosphoshikimate 1-carboxyvinyltransferase [Ilumatobacteraceae bacterium]
MTQTKRVRRANGPLDAVVTVPGSKSIANRVLICAALAEGSSELSNMPDGDDTKAMLACLRELGLDASLDGDRAAIFGVGTEWPPGAHTLHAGLAGTTSRFVTALASLGAARVTIDGDPPLRERPFGPLHDALGQLGVRVSTGERYGTLPAVIEGPPTRGCVSIRGDVSSQYVSALMLIGPYLPDGLALALTSPLISRPYVELTAATMGWFGVDQVEITERTVRVGAGRYEPATILVEPDASSASYPLALAAVHGGSVTIPGLGTGSLQGDARFADVLGSMGCTVVRSADAVTVSGHGRLNGVDIDMADVSDLVPTLAVVAAFAATATRITGVGFIRGKESDRLGDLTGELRAAGVDIDEHDDGLEIRPSTGRLHSAQLATHHDHRLAMAFGVLGSMVSDIDVENPDVVSKSWPAFWTVLDDLLA